ncbi:MAG: terpene cyclase/mutase family protein [Candidatus Nanopelagicales bacterium]|nr:terpene cyclase/mutase family protein [Candidatus Nanopelagicales bacterium]
MNRMITRTITAFAGIGLATAGLAAPAFAASPDAGLFGSMDPTYDGVFRQGVSIIALAPLKQVPAEALTWLRGQQCLDGSFEAYRASIRTACAAPDPLKFTGPDSNSTALAAMAFRSVQQHEPADRAIAALVAKQNADGGWGYTLGGASDVNSTGLVVAALQGAATLPTNAAAKNRGLAYLTSTQVPCTGAGTFGLPYQAGGPADALASAQALVGIAGTLPANKPTAYASLTRTSCTSTLQAKVAAFLNQSLVSGKGTLASSLDPKQTDWNATASAVVGLASARQGRAGVSAGLAQLQRNVAAYTGPADKFKVAADATLIMVARVTGTSPRAFGTARTNLVAALLNSITK